jgi:hypothetical protein
MHVTIYLEPADSPSNTHAFIHAAPDGVVIEDIEGWQEMPKYRHAGYAGAIRNICKAASAEPRAPAMSRSGTTANWTI